MKSINSWRDLERFGIEVLTGESCGLNYRLLFDCTEKGRKILARLLGIPRLQLAEPWNRGTPEEPHVGSILLSREMLMPVATFALLENGCSEVWVVEGDTAFGLEPSDDRDEMLKLILGPHRKNMLRRFAYQGTAGDRNIHQMSGRIE
jgi:hypothetical protein